MGDVYCCERPECSTKVAVPGGAVAECMDFCIVPELKKLWSQGIRTTCSCCGHGDDQKAYIRVDGMSANKMLALGYEPYEPHRCIFERGSVSFRAKEVKAERLKGGPEGPVDLEEVRRQWKASAHYGGKDYV